MSEKIPATSDQKKTVDSALSKLNESLDKSDSRSVDQHNIVFRQMAAQLILIAGIFLALSSQISLQLSKSHFAVKLLAVIIITLLNLSIIFGVIQHMMEAAFFKNLALGRREIRKTINGDDLSTLKEFIGASKQFSKMMGAGTKRWPTYVQLTLLGFAMLLISITAGLKLFGL